MQSAAHQEKHFQQYIIDRLVDQGWKLGDSSSTTPSGRCNLKTGKLDQNQRPAGKWDKLERLNGAKTLEVLMDRLDKALEKQGTMQVLRQSFHCRLRPDRDESSRTGRQAQCSSH